MLARRHGGDRAEGLRHMGYLADIIALLRADTTKGVEGEVCPAWNERTSAEWLLAAPPTFSGQRDAMVEALQERVAWLTDFIGIEAIQRALSSMARVPRERFITPLVEELAYLPMALDIGFGQTISHPEMVLTMVASVGLGRGHVLDVGTGCGYQAAVLSGMVNQVTSIEIIPALAKQAQIRLRNLGIQNTEILVGDAAAPGQFSLNQFDAIVIAAGAHDVPPTLLAALREGGRLIMPLGPAQDEETLTLIEKLPAGDIRRVPLCSARFVPLTGVGRRKRMKR
jgi:protein-L-isoaspartate(D-aspartate) O-methyltransferase